MTPINTASTGTLGSLVSKEEKWKGEKVAAKVPFSSYRRLLPRKPWIS